MKTEINKDRRTLTDLLKEGSIGCEVGVFKGDFSRQLLDSGKFKKLYLIDPFTGVVGSGDKDGRNHESWDGKELRKFVKNRFLQEWNEGIVYLGNEYSYEFFSPEELCLIEAFDRLFNFVYLDSDHSFENVKNELNLCWDFVEEGGIIAGHDYNLEGAGVEQAVTEFCEERGIDWFVLTGDGLHSFYFYKKEI